MHGPTVIARDGDELVISSPHRGAGIAAVRLHQGLRSIGVDSRMAVLHKRSADPTVRLIPSPAGGPMLQDKRGDLLSPLLLDVHGSWRGILARYPHRPEGLEMFSDPRGLARLDVVRDLRDADVVSRWGGEEFVALFLVDSPEAAPGVAERLRASVSNREVGATLSGGVVIWRDAEALPTAISRADRLMYEAKHEGRNRLKADCGLLASG